MKKPFVKFITHSASYAFFLCEEKKKMFIIFKLQLKSFIPALLGAASQRIEFLLLEWFGNAWVHSILAEWKKHERGALPGIAESMCMIYIISLIWGEIRSLYADGLIDYIADLWQVFISVSCCHLQCIPDLLFWLITSFFNCRNIVDFISNSFYVAWISLRFTAYYTVQRDANAGLNAWYPREDWSPFDPMLLSEGAFAAGMIFSFLKLVHIFSINPHLG